ncbi:MAG: glycine cleavage system protein GcvH [Gammaproteobacteria bacterium]|nr:glycine cleavage system protein GcvH [Gammaproteobacteria bacterium]
MNVKFTKTHEWIKQDHPQECTIGITAHAQELLGDMVYVELPQAGTVVQAGDSIAVVESVKAASDVYAPISGTITEVNTLVQKSPDIINTDPFGAGWLIKLTPADPNEFNTLLSDNAYQQSIVEH